MTDSAHRGDLLTFDEAVALCGVTDAPAVREDLRRVCGLDPDTARFRRTTLTLDRARCWVSPLESYLLDGDEAGYESAVALSDAYTAGDPLPPVLFGWLAGDDTSLQLLDGCHRLAAAGAADLTSVPAVEVLPGP